MISFTKKSSIFNDHGYKTCLKIQETENKVILSDQKIISEESNYVKEMGELRIYQSIKSPVFDEQGNVIGLCGISTDITEQKRLGKVIDEQQNLLNVVLDNIEAHVYMKSEDRRFYTSIRKLPMFLVYRPRKLLVN